MNREVITRIACVASRLYRAGKVPVIVTSGAVAAGMELNGLQARPSDVGCLQDLSAEGARLLWNVYADAFSEYGLGAVYIPVTWHNFEDASDLKNIRERVDSASSRGKVVLFNTNDALSNQELASRNSNGFYDNDPLAVLVASCVGAGALVFFTDSGCMGSGGGSSKAKAIESAKSLGIYVAVYSIGQLEEVFGMQKF